MNVTEFEFNMNDPDALIKSFHWIRDDLIKMRPVTHRPKLLEWQVRLYDYCLNSPNAKELCEKYMAAKKGNLISSVPKTRQMELMVCALAVGFNEPMPKEEK